ncbi:unnamed protein product [Meloidogyne enterolobii]|uniref:Uncharacterized protein n=1 Tax=Meloidogyne enterolobii TaxID=390850 RepID=A0ACB1AIC0_MELEN
MNSSSKMSADAQWRIMATMTPSPVIIFPSNRLVINAPFNMRKEHELLVENVGPVAFAFQSNFCEKIGVADICGVIRPQEVLRTSIIWEPSQPQEGLYIRLVTFNVPVNQGRRFRGSWLQEPGIKNHKRIGIDALLRAQP